MAKKEKEPKKQKTAQGLPRPTRIDDAYEKQLLRKKRELQNKIERLRGRRAHQIGSTGFWGAFTVIAMTGDMALLGGMGTGMVMGSIFLASTFGVVAGDTAQQLKEVEERLKEYRELKDILKPSAPASKPMPTSPADDFKKAAVPEKKLAEMEKKLSELTRQMKSAKESKGPKPPLP